MNKNKLKDIIELAAGWVAAWTLSSKKSPIDKDIPRKEFGNVEVLPNFEIKKGKSIYHIHHWMNLTLLYLPLLKIKKLNKNILRLFTLGYLLQGLSYKDRFKIKEDASSKNGK